jgi:hypothetical protein
VLEAIRGQAGSEARLKDDAIADAVVARKLDLDIVFFVEVDNFRVAIAKLFIGLLRPLRELFGVFVVRQSVDGVRQMVPPLKVI